MLRQIPFVATFIRTFRQDTLNSAINSSFWLPLHNDLLAISKAQAQDRRTLANNSSSYPMPPFAFPYNQIEKAIADFAQILDLIEAFARQGSKSDAVSGQASHDLLEQFVAELT